MRILITGGAGFIGSHTADALIAQGHKVRIMDNLHPTVHPEGRPPGYLPSGTEFFKGDVRRMADWQKALDGIDAVYHLAAYQDYLTDFSTFFAVNAVGTALLYEVLVAQKARFKVKKVIVAASQAVMGEGRYICPQCATDPADYVYPRIRLEAQLSRGQWDHLCQCCGQPLKWVPSDESVISPCNQYALSKHSQEQIAIELGKRYGIASVVMRYSIVQGPRQSLYNAYSGAMRIFALSLLCNRRPLIYEDGKQVRDFVNIADVVAANLLVLERPEADWQVFNVGGGKPWEIIDFYRKMEELTGRSLEPRMQGYYRYGDTRHIVSDISKLRKLGWQPKHGVDKSITDYWNYLKKQTANSQVLAAAEAQMKALKVVRKANNK